MRHMDKIAMRVVAYQQGDLWVAQGIEFDIFARSKTLAKLPQAFECAVIANLCVNEELGRVGLEGIGPAPDRFRILYEQDAETIDVAPRLVEDRSKLDIRIAA